MTPDSVLTLTTELLKQALFLSLPLMIAITAASVVVGVLQVVTQMQDPSIAFVPKFIVFLVAFGVLAPWMLGRLREFGLAMFAQLMAVR